MSSALPTTIMQDIVPGSAAIAIPPREKRGVVYTKHWVVELILDLVGYTSDADLGSMLAIEPAAGDGSFLTTMLERLITSCRHHKRSVTDCTQALISYELDSEVTQATRSALSDVLQQHGLASEKITSLVTTWVRTGDYLLQAPSLPEADFVIGNPPYVRLEDMDNATADQNRRQYRTMVGRADLYVAFFEAALRQLTPGGVCADRWMLNQYGAELRRLITASFSVDAVIEMHRADAFAFEVSAYPAITVIRRNPQGLRSLLGPTPALNVPRCPQSTVRWLKLAGPPISGPVTPRNGWRCSSVWRLSSIPSSPPAPGPNPASAWPPGRMRSSLPRIPTWRSHRAYSLWPWPTTLELVRSPGPVTT